MRLNTIKILGISVTTNSKKEILEYVRKYLKDTSNFKLQTVKLRIKPLVIVTPNPEQVVLAQRDKQFANILNQADVAIPDGIGIAVASRFLKNSELRTQNSEPLKRIPGVELMDDLVGMAAKEGVRIGLIGGRGGVAIKALECLQQKHPNLKGWADDGPEVEATENGVRIMYYGNTNNPSLRSIRHNTTTIIHSSDTTVDYFQMIARRIQESDTRFVFVGLGAPKQEYFVNSIMESVLRIMGENKKKSKTNSILHNTYPTPLVFMSVGGSFDMLAGRVGRAPFIMRHVGLEWLWRLVREPWRWKRQLALLKFFWLTMREYLA